MGVMVVAEGCASHASLMTGEVATALKLGATGLVREFLRMCAL
ncbi:MAG: hypothetical protein Q8S75_09550 [Nitrospirota bacterium]|nr:hypothetical protein [Nitrospirota bacterium]